MHDGLCDAGFDPALSYSLTVDHGVVQGYEMATGDAGVPMVPIVLNTAAPPLPSLARCRDLGVALGEVLRAAPYDGRVLVVASGGLSHWLPSNDPRDPSVVGEKREALIHGRADAEAFAAAREPRVRAMGGDPDARVNRDWDRWFLDVLGGTDLEPVVALGHDGLEEAAGSGGPRDPRLAGRPRRRRRAAGVDELRAGAGVDHRHGHRHHLRGAVTSGQREDDVAQHRRTVPLAADHGGRTEDPVVLAPATHLQRLAWIDHAGELHREPATGSRRRRAAPW